MSPEHRSTSESFQDAAYDALLKPRATPGFLSRTTTHWKYIEDTQNRQALFLFFPSKETPAFTGKENALIYRYEEIFVAHADSRNIQRMGEIEHGMKYARLQERFNQAHKNQTYKHPAVATDWLSALSLEQEHRIMTDHHTCKELEDHWIDIFRIYSPGISFIKFNDEGLSWKLPWLPRGSHVRTPYPTLIKNPDHTSDRNDIHGARNGIVPVEINGTTVMFACSVSSSGSIIPARPIELAAQELTQQHFMRIYQREMR